MILFQTVQTLYWLSLSTWFGGVLFVAITAPRVLRVIHEHKPLLPGVLSVNLDNQHATLLGGAVVFDLIGSVHRVATWAAAGLTLAVIGQWALADHSGANLWLGIVRTTLLIAAIALLAYDRRVLRPQLLDCRQRYIDHADDPDIANPAKDQFDQLHHLSIAVTRNLLFVLLGLVLLGAGVTLSPLTLLQFR